ncbi:MAG TPA: AAA family ATPase, partial [Candidatus Kapabacteria bacterium]|nr:AAA family ATPase [Candidatus Kapabacteria bacterium]
MNTMTNPEEVKQIPYGMTDYKLVRRGNYYYLDKTPYIKEIEHFGRYLFFIRPRRFGKSFFLSLLESYYDVYYKDQLEELFSGTWIYEHPTPERGQYLVLSFNFSQVDSSVGKPDISFLDYIRRAIVNFLGKYNSLLAKNPKMAYYCRAIEEDKSLAPADLLSNLMYLVIGSGCDLYVIIDEYDNFANTLLTTSGSASYIKITRGEGFLRSFFNVLKGGTTGTDAPIKRLFITGVSPITMDDVTSGFNIGEQISLLPQFNQMLGFT